MRKWITDYIKGCAICQQAKINMHLRKVPLYRIPSKEGTRPFQVISMDLITGLPMDKGNDAISTIVDYGCLRAALFIPCSTTITSLGIAQKYF